MIPKLILLLVCGMMASGCKLVDRHYGEIQCHECHHWVDKADVQEVEYTGSWALEISHIYYCFIHKKPYDRVMDFQKYKKVPEHWERVYDDPVSTITFSNFSYPGPRSHKLN